MLFFTFLVGYELCLPLPPEDSPVAVPFVFTPMLIMGRLSLKEVVLVVHAFANIRLLTRILPRKRIPALLGIYWMFIVGGILSVAINMLPRDIPEVGRFVASAYYIFAVRAYIVRYGVRPLIVALIFGLIVSGVVNLGYTFGSPRGYLGALPLLWGQNGPGGFAGAFVALSFILAQYLKGGFEKTLLRVAILLCCLIVLMSFSKLAMLMAMCGVLTWVSSLWMAQRDLAKRYVIFVGTFTLLVIGAVRFTPDAVKMQLETIYEYKFYNAGEGLFDESDMTRWGYFAGVGEIIAYNPLGVSYTGIGAGLQRTAAYRAGRLPQEESVVEANPHNSFLYYIAANGVIGWLATTLFFVYFLKVTWRVLAERTRAGLYYTCLVAGAMLLYVNTLPSFFNAFFIQSVLLYMIYAASATNGSSFPSRVEA